MPRNSAITDFFRPRGAPAPAATESSRPAARQSLSSSTSREPNVQNVPRALPSSGSGYPQGPGSSPVTAARGQPSNNTPALQPPASSAPSSAFRRVPEDSRPPPSPQLYTDRSSGSGRTTLARSTSGSSPFPVSPSSASPTLTASGGRLQANPQIHLPPRSLQEPSSPFKTGPLDSVFFSSLPSSPAPLPPSSPDIALVGGSRKKSEIKASDDEDEDGDSDSDEFPDLFAKPAGGDTPSSAPRAARPWETPPTKRRAIAFPKPSPLFPKDGRLDMKKLVAQAKQFERDEALAAEIQEHDLDSDAEDHRRTLDEDMKDVLLDQDDSGKLLLAVKRTGTAMRTQWCFFGSPSNLGSHHAGAAPFPKEAAQGKWGILSDDNTRSSHFMSGIVHTIQTRHRSLPPEILAWIWDEATRERSGALRERYVELFKLCDDHQIGPVITEQRVSDTFKRLGAVNEAVYPNLSVTPTQVPADASADRVAHRKSTANLCSVLELFGALADKLDEKARVRAIHVLLRLGIDDIVHDDIVVGSGYRKAMEKLTNSVPAAAWEDLCTNLASSLYIKVEDVSLRWDGILGFLGGGGSRLWQLQRASALVSAGVSDLDQIDFDVSDVLKSLEDPGFVIKPDTDYHALAALVATLSVAVGDADKPAGKPRDAAVVRHDAEIDAVVQKLKEIESRIHYSSMNNSGPKMAAKWQLDCLQMLLECVARSREPSKATILSDPDAAIRRDSPRQRSFMQKFLARNRSRAATDTESLHDTTEPSSGEKDDRGTNDGGTIHVKLGPADDNDMKTSF